MRHGYEGSGGRKCVSGDDIVRQLQGSFMVSCVIKA